MDCRRTGYRSDTAAMSMSGIRPATGITGVAPGVMSAVGIAGVMAGFMSSTGIRRPATGITGVTPGFMSATGIRRSATRDDRAATRSHRTVCRTTEAALSQVTLFVTFYGICDAHKEECEQRRA